MADYQHPRIISPAETCNRIPNLGFAGFNPVLYTNILFTNIVFSPENKFVFLFVF